MLHVGTQNISIHQGHFLNTVNHRGSFFCRSGEMPLPTANQPSHHVNEILRLAT